MIAVLGSINLDFVASAIRLPACGETVAGVKFDVFPGGKGANQALACRRAGSQVMLCGLIGDDGHGERALTNLRETGVDLSLVTQTSGPSGIASIFVGNDGDNMIISIPGSNGRVGQREVDALFQKVREGDVLVLQLEIPTEVIRVALKRARDARVRVILNVAPYTSQATELVRMADVVVVNEKEMADLARGEGLDTFCPRTLAKTIGPHPSQIFVVTRGKDGASAYQGDKVYEASAAQITPVDTVGAGDAFVGYLANAIEEGLHVQWALERASIAGSLACLTPGAQTSVPSRLDVDRMLAEARKA